jgi:CheY-like chemotaxis protein
VLVVDDEPAILKVVGRRLELEGFRVLTAADGQEALAKVQAGGVDLVVLDLMMPVLDGYEVCARLKQDPDLRRIPVVILTAKTHERDERQAMACGADAYMRKPFHAEALLAKVRALLDAGAAA